MTEFELMKDFDGEKHGDRYCNKMCCNACSGTDESGEPNGYGCTGQEEYEQKQYDSILKRRLKKQDWIK